LGWVTMSERDLKRVEVLAEVLSGGRNRISCLLNVRILRTRWFRNLGQQCLNPFDFEPPEFGSTGPLFHSFAVGREFR